MGFTIEDGTGDGYNAKVNNRNMLNTSAVVSSVEHYVNRKEGNSYNLLFSVLTASGTDNCVLYIKNEGESDLIFEGITTRSTSDEVLEIKLKDAGVPVGGSDITPANLNAGSANQVTGTFQVASSITGLSGGTAIFKFFMVGADKSTHYNFEQDVILPKNRTLTFYCANGNTQIDGFLSFFVFQDSL